MPDTPSTRRPLLGCRICGAVGDDLCDHLRATPAGSPVIVIGVSRFGCGEMDRTPVTIRISSDTGLPLIDRW